MGLLLSRSHLHGENNSPQSAFYTDRFVYTIYLNFLSLRIPSVDLEKDHDH